MANDVRWVQLEGTFDPNWKTLYRVFQAYVYRAKVEHLGRRKRRTLSIEGQIRNVASIRHGSTALSSRTSFDHGGHLIAARFGGPTKRANLVPMHGAINGSGGRWYRMEDEIAEMLRRDPRGGPATMLVQVSYDNEASLRPLAFQVQVVMPGSARRTWHMENYNPLLLDPRDPEYWRSRILLRLREQQEPQRITDAERTEALDRLAGCEDAGRLQRVHEEINEGARIPGVITRLVPEATED